MIVCGIYIIQATNDMPCSFSSVAIKRTGCWGQSSLLKENLYQVLKQILQKKHRPKFHYIYIYTKIQSEWRLFNRLQIQISVPLASSHGRSASMDRIYQQEWTNPMFFLQIKTPWFCSNQTSRLRQVLQENLRCGRGHRRTLGRTKGLTADSEMIMALKTNDKAWIDRMTFLGMTKEFVTILLYYIDIQLIHLGGK